MLDIRFRLPRKPRKCGMHRNKPLLLELLHLFKIDTIRGVAAAEIEMCRAKLGPLPLECASSLEESAERRDPYPRSDHNDWSSRIFREPEA